MLILAALLLAQINFVYAPGEAPPGYVRPLAIGCALPAAPLSTGLQPKPFTWGGYKWNNDSGQTWNTHVPYAINVCTNGHVKFELHDTAYDHGLSDPSTKRRAEIGATATNEKFHNNTPYWLAFSFTEHWDCIACMQGSNVRIAQPLHWPSGASPAVGMSAVYLNGGAGFRITTCGDSHVNITRATVPLALDTVHDVVMQVTPNGTNGLLNVWLDGKPILNLTGVPVGSLKEDGYTFRIGAYGLLNGNLVREEIGNIAAFPSGVNLSGRIASPPAW